MADKDIKLCLEQVTDKDIAVFEEIGDVAMDYIHAEAYIGILCLAGKASCRIEDKEYHIGKNDLIIAHPNQFIQNAMISCDFKCQGLWMSPSYFENIFMVGGNIWEASFIIQDQPLLHLDDEEVEHFLFDFEVIKKKMAATHLPHHGQIIKLLLQSFVYEFYDNIAPKLTAQLSDRNYSSAEVIFKRFIKMVSTEAIQHHDVAYFAGKLCITPKYLSAVCKKQSGKTASDLINQVASNYIRHMLSSSDKSIKEIAADTGFTNLSFFGKYVRRELGMSPRDYRQKGEA